MRHILMHSGYLVCVAVLAVFAVAIGVICFRHYRKKGRFRKTLKFPSPDEEKLVDVEAAPAAAAADKKKLDEPVKVVVLKRNGAKDHDKKATEADDSEGTCTSFHHSITASWFSGCLIQFNLFDSSCRTHPSVVCTIPSIKFAYFPRI